MINQLSNEQVVQFWDVIRYAIEQSLPPNVTNKYDTMNNILERLLMSQAQCWAVYDVGEKRTLKGIVVTYIWEDFLSASRNLVIYALYGIDILTSEDYKQGIMVLIKFALKEKCSKLVAFSANEKIVRLVERFGGNADCRLIELPL